MQAWRERYALSSWSRNRKALETVWPDRSCLLGGFPFASIHSRLAFAWSRCWYGAWRASSLHRETDREHLQQHLPASVHLGKCSGQRLHGMKGHHWSRILVWSFVFTQLPPQGSVIDLELKTSNPGGCHHWSREEVLSRSEESVYYSQIPDIPPWINPKWIESRETQWRQHPSHCWPQETDKHCHQMEQHERALECCHLPQVALQKPSVNQQRLKDLVYTPQQHHHQKQLGLCFPQWLSWDSEDYPHLHAGEWFRMNNTKKNHYTTDNRFTLD